MRILVTRPEPDNARTAAALRDLGHEVVLAPLLRIEAVANADLGPPPWSGVLITSANGARALAGHPRRGELLALPVLAVGGSSADAARTAGFTDVSSADGDASDLARLAAERFSGARHPLLYLAGEDRSGELSVAGLTIRTVVVYRARAATSLPAHGRIDGVLHFSRRSVEAYLACGGAVVGAGTLLPVGAGRRTAQGRRRHAHRGRGAAGRGEPAFFGHAKVLIELSRMAHGR